MTLEPILKIGGEWLDAASASARGLHLAETQERSVRRVSLENRSGATIRPAELGWRNAPGSDDFDVPGLKVWLEGWQMATPCGVRRWNDAPFDYSPAYLPNCVSTPEDFRPGERGRFLADNACCLRRPDGAMRLFGFTTGANRFGHFAMALGASGIDEFFALSACDGAELLPGGRIETESLFVKDGMDTEVLFSEYAERWAADSDARRKAAQPVGWCSWYCCFRKVALADCIESADWLAAHRDDPAFGAARIVQLDDGYCDRCGDWLDWNAKFPGGAETFAREIRARGLVPGLWLAPFWADADSRLAAEHPDWLVRGPDGSPAPCPGFGTPDRPRYALDATNPAVQSHLEALFRTLRSLGIDYAKLDFCMSECAIAGARFFDPTATRAQALRRGLEAIRRGFGDDGFLLACTTPFAPAVGIVDAMRVSTDITPYWCKSGVHQFAEAPNVPNVCRNVVNHAYQNGRLWINDPDTLLVRDSDTELSESEVRLWADAISLAGGSLMLSDRLGTLSPERLELARRVLAQRGKVDGLFPEDRWARTAPAVWTSQIAGRTHRVLFNCGDSPADVFGQTIPPHASLADASGRLPAASAERPHCILGVKLKTGDDRPVTPLDSGFPLLGRLRARGAREVGRSNWTIGCEVLDRDFANFWEYCEFVEPLGIKTVRLQAGWAKCEKVPGVFDFRWLDDIVDYLRAQSLDVILETSYGNPIHEGAGGWDLSGGIPSTENGLAAWDRWIDALSKHFAGRVQNWAMWNEPDNNRAVNTPERVADFNLRTALAIRKNIPDACLQGLSLGGNDPEYFEACLKRLAEKNAVDLFETYVYHGYELAPERSYPMVEAKKSILAKYSSKARLRQGENGCPSEMIDFFALWNNPWSEISQAKWDMRRMLGDFCHGVESSVYTMSDFRHKGETIRSPNNKGLVRANANRETIAIKQAYYAVQNVAGLFDSSVSTDPAGRATCTDITIFLAPCIKRTADGTDHPLIVFWTQGHMAAKDDWTQVKPGDLILDRPSDSFETRPAVIEWIGAPFVNPVWIDLITGRVYAFPKECQLVHSAGVTLIDVPVYDSPCAITERTSIEIDDV